VPSFGVGGEGGEEPSGEPLLERSDRKSIAPPSWSNISNNLLLVASLLTADRSFPSQECVEEKKCYYPQTYVTDGHYTHATGVPSRLVTTANRFYQDSVGAWICLKFTRKALYDRGVHVKDERAMPVGEKKVSEEWGEWVCPHVMGGLVTDVVDKVYDMRRDEKGGFVGIEGLEGA